MDAYRFHRQLNNLWKHMAIRNGWAIEVAEVDVTYEQHLQAGMEAMKFLRSRTQERNDLMDLYALRAGITRHA